VVYENGINSDYWTFELLISLNFFIALKCFEEKHLTRDLVSSLNVLVPTISMTLIQLENWWLTSVTIWNYRQVSYSDLTLSSGALCTSEVATRRSTRITVFMVFAVCSCRETDWSSGSVLWNLYPVTYRKRGTKSHRFMSPEFKILVYWELYGTWNDAV
jgi:hypothetical protein